MNELLYIKNIYREDVLELEKKMRQHSDVKLGDSFPLKHSFADGMYIRELSVPAGVLFVTKLHKQTHPMFLLKGEVDIISDGIITKVSAPYSFITPAGTKRTVYTHTDIIWTTVHRTNKLNMKKIEKEVIANNFSEIDDIKINKQLLRLKEAGDSIHAIEKNGEFVSISNNELLKQES